jgi:predicted nucleotidyltransferase
MTDMNEITARISHWLAANNLEHEGVRIVLEFPTKAGAQKAEMTIKREVEPMMAHYVTGGSFGAIETMNGLGLTLRATPARS